MESLEIKKYYEWSTTSRIGRVEEYVAEDDTNVYFQSGRFIPKDQLDIQLKLVDESTYLSRGGESQFAPQPPPPAPQTIVEWERMLGNPTPNSIEPPNPSNGISNQQSTPQLVEEKSPIRIILEKQKKKTVKDISIPFEFNFPSEKAIEFMMMMFDEEEVIEEIIEFALSQMSTEEIKEIIKENIKESIKKLLPSIESE
jgi:predicted small metal-binding protein